MSEVHKLDHLSIEDRLAAFTEYNLATLEWLEMTKSSSKSSVRRQSSICDMMVRACQAFGAVGPNRFGGPECSRLSMRLAALADDTQPGTQDRNAGRSETQSGSSNEEVRG